MAPRPFRGLVPPTFSGTLSLSASGSDGLEVSWDEAFADAGGVGVASVTVYHAATAPGGDLAAWKAGATTNAASAGSWDGAHAHAVSGLASGSTYHVRVAVADGAGNVLDLAPTPSSVELEAPAPAFPTPNPGDSVPGDYATLQDWVAGFGPGSRSSAHELAVEPGTGYLSADARNGNVKLYTVPFSFSTAATITAQYRIDDSSSKNNKRDFVGLTDGGSGMYGIFINYEANRIQMFTKDKTPIVAGSVGQFQGDTSRKIVVRLSGVTSTVYCTVYADQAESSVLFSFEQPVDVSGVSVVKGYVMLNENMTGSNSSTRYLGDVTVHGDTVKQTEIPALTANSDQGYTASASTEITAFGFTANAYKAFSRGNGTLRAGWSASAAEPQHLAIQLPSPKTFVSFRLWSTSAWSSSLTESFRVEGSSDGASWTTLGTYDDVSYQTILDEDKASNVYFQTDFDVDTKAGDDDSYLFQDSLQSPGEYSHYRLLVTKSGNRPTVSEWVLL